MDDEEVIDEGAAVVEDELIDSVQDEIVDDAVETVEDAAPELTVTDAMNAISELRETVEALSKLVREGMAMRVEDGDVVNEITDTIDDNIIDFDPLIDLDDMSMGIVQEELMDELDLSL